MNKNEMKARYSIQNQCQLINPNSGNPITGDRIYDRDTVLGEWYDTGNEVAAPKIIQALNEYEALRDVEMAARDLSDALRSGDSQMRLSARMNLDKAIAHLNILRATQTK